jgi:membrane-bound lytic murein transglycosylase F
LFKNVFLLIISWLALLALSGCDFKNSPTVKVVAKQSQLSTLAQIKHRGVLHVLTRTSATTYYANANSYAGLEYDLATLFAKQLGVKVQFHTAKTFPDILNKTALAQIDIAAAGLAITESRTKKVRFSVPYHEIVEQLLYRADTPRPQTLSDLNNGILEVADGSHHLDSLKNLRKTVAPQLTWLTNSEQDSDDLIALLNDGLIDYTVADSTQALLIQRFYPQLQIAFDISSPRQIGWALPKSADDSLYNAVNSFFKRIKQDNTLAQLLERYYGHVGALAYEDKCKFYQHQQQRLPLYKPYFIKAAQQQGLDWRLLAAIGYQESHWQDSAVSPTGVKGIMMLTNDTALQVGVNDRTNPIQSIKGGAIYFQQQLDKIPARISDPDRTWFALAAYNVGYGHLEDARVLTQQQGRNPDKWLDVKQSLPLLAQQYWFMQTKHGYARGDEPVVYVENIRNYYDLLIWLSAEKAHFNKTNEPSSRHKFSLFLNSLRDFLRQVSKAFLTFFEK